MNQGYYLTLMMGPLTFEPVERDLVDAITSVEVTRNAGQRGGFQLSFSASKNSRIVKDLLPSGFFDSPRRVVLVLTMRGQATTLADGVITRQEFQPSNEPGQSTLSITGVDISQVMDLIDASGTPFPAMPAEARVAFLLARYAPWGVVPIIIPSPALFVFSPTEKIPAQQGTDYHYMRTLAENTGYEFTVEPGDKPGVNFAYWGPARKFGDVQPALSVNMDAASNVESLSFSFDGLGKKQFLFRIQIPETKTSIPIPVPDISPINPPLGVRQPVPLGIETLNNPSDDKEKIATAKLSVVEAIFRGMARTAAAADVISGSGTLDTLTYGTVLQAGKLVGVRGAGSNYDGLYYVRSVTHRMKRGSWKQSFSLARNAFMSQSSGVAV